MYNHATYDDFISAIRSASDIRAFRTAVRNYLNDSAMEWWHGLEDDERQAIILLDFDPSVMTTMVFFGRDSGFGRDWGFGGGYHDILDAIFEKAELLANEEELSDWDSDLDSVIYYARAQAQAEQTAREKAAAIAQEMNLVAGYNTLENLLIKNSSKVRDSKKHKTEKAKEMRKAFLADVLYYLRENYKNWEKDE